MQNIALHCNGRFMSRLSKNQSCYWGEDETNFKGNQKGGDKRGEFGDCGSGHEEKELSVAGDGQWHGEQGQEEKQVMERHPGAAGLHCRVQFTW